MQITEDAKNDLEKNIISSYDMLSVFNLDILIF